MAKRFFVGDKVKTKFGIGLIHTVTTWRDAIIELHEFEIDNFCARCKLEVGLNFREDWIQLLVNIHGGLVKVQAKDIELLEGRDDTNAEGSLGFVTSKEGAEKNGRGGPDPGEGGEKAGE